MAYPTSQQADDVAALATDINSRILVVCDGLRGWRDRIVASSPPAIDSGDAQTQYQTIVGLHNFVEAKKSTPGLGAAVRQMFTQLDPAFDPPTQWGGSKSAIEALVNWVQANWPEKTASGKPAYVAWAATGEHVPFSVPLTAAAKTALLNRIDAVLSSFV